MKYVVFMSRWLRTIKGDFFWGPRENEKSRHMMEKIPSELINVV